MKRMSVTLAAVLLTVLPALARVASAQDALDFEIPGGRFYKQANGVGGAGTNGFSVVDGGADLNGNAVTMYSGYIALGGPAIWGFPISYRFQFAPQDPYIYQAFQNGLLQWDPVSRTVRPANLMDMLSQAGYDAQMQAWGYPPRQDDASGGNFAAAQVERLAWLNDPAFADLRAAYLARGEATLGLPGARPVTMGWIRALRTQRTVLATYNHGPVVFASAGDDAKRLGYLNGDAMTAGGSEANRALTASIMTARSATPGQPAAISAPTPAFAYQYRPVYTRTGNRCDRTLLKGDVRDVFGVPRNAVYFRTYNDEGNEVFFLSGLDQPIPGTWIRDMGPGPRPGIWKVEIVSEPNGARLSETAVVRFDATCDTAQSVNEITIFFEENPYRAPSS